MSKNVNESTRTHAVVRRVVRRWSVAGFGGIAACAAAGASPLPQSLPAWMASVLAAACGLTLLLLLAPWKLMRTVATDVRPELRQLNNTLRAIVDGDRTSSLKDIVLDRDDELGELSRLAHDLAAEAISGRQHTRLLHRRMNDSIMRETKRATFHLQRQAATDPLTKLGNRRALEQRLHEFVRSHPAGCLLTIVAIDLDSFKEVNDTLGHDVGDQCLVFLANVLQSGIRHEDCAIRLGGDEFLIVMPEQTLDQATVVAERMASLFAQMPWKHASPVRPTLSFGVACGSVRVIADAVDLLRRADAALYHAKHSRHNDSTTMNTQQRGAA